MFVNGFKAAATAAGLKYKNRPDLGLIVSDHPVPIAGVFTTSLTKAAPVLWCQKHLKNNKARAILVNAGQANACTGDPGMNDCRESAQAVAGALNCPPEEIYLASTGVIGMPVNMTALKSAVPGLAESITPDGLDAVSKAMMTTDTVPKTVQKEISIDDKTITIAGMTKGSGMIAPNMATMLCFILTDAAVEPAYLQDVLTNTTELTFNRITVDGDTSTNDTVLAMASGTAKNAVLKNKDSTGAEEFYSAFLQVMDELAAMIVADGEGATKLVTIQVNGAKDDHQAKQAAMTVANSPLVKTALFGCDPNWGRILAALGRSGADFDPYKVNIWVDDKIMVQNGMAAGIEAESAAVMKLPKFTVRIEMNYGPASAKVLTCDFSYDYVKINADYRS
jgi:glutamate N-acetyltransferase/amino-acid N-acetyltransferase